MAKGNGNNIEKKKDYEVGYGKPPKATRFQKGQVGNPKGRPKGRKNFKTEAQDAFRANVRMKRDGKPRNVSSQEALFLTLFEQALVRKDIRAIKTCIELGRVYNDDESISEQTSLSEQDKALLEAFARRLTSEEFEEGAPDFDDGCEDS